MITMLCGLCWNLNHFPGFKDLYFKGTCCQFCIKQKNYNRGMKIYLNTYVLTIQQNPSIPFGDGGII